MTPPSFADVGSKAIRAFHDACIARTDAGAARVPVAADSVWHWIEANHCSNLLLWAEEDLARRMHVPDAEIAANKRAIDRYNQDRNDATERIDEVLLARLAGVVPAADAWHNSETAGSMIDRLSILSLKRFHMRLQAERADASAAHREACALKQAQLERQADDLARCLDTLFDEAVRGRAFWRTYRQFKMYNDPALNPHVTA
jgi:hypothetical protein